MRRKKPFNLIALFVQLLITIPRIFSIAFRRDYRDITELHSQSSGLIPLFRQKKSRTSGTPRYPPSYSELRCGQDGSRLPNKRMRYNADLAQLRIQQSFERRGRRTGEGPGQKEVNPAQDWKYSVEDAPKPSGGLGMIDISGVRGDDEPRGRSRQPTGTVSPGGPRLNDFTKVPAVV